MRDPPSVILLWENTCKIASWHTLLRESARPPMHVGAAQPPAHLALIVVTIRGDGLHVADVLMTLSRALSYPSW